MSCTSWVREVCSFASWAGMPVRAAGARPLQPGPQGPRPQDRRQPQGSAAGSPDCLEPCPLLLLKTLRPQNTCLLQRQAQGRTGALGLLLRLEPRTLERGLLELGYAPGHECPLRRLGVPKLEAIAGQTGGGLGCARPQHAWGTSPTGAFQLGTLKERERQGVDREGWGKWCETEAEF